MNQVDWELNFYLLLTIWSSIFVLSLVSLIFKKEKLKDKIFKPGKFSFELVKERLKYLSSFTDKELLAANILVDGYQKNAIRTKRKFSHYISYIEPGFLKILMGHYKSRYKLFTQLTDLTFRSHFIFIFLIPIFFFLLNFIILNQAPLDVLLLFIILLIPIGLLSMHVVALLSLFIFHVIDILLFQPLGKGILTRNIEVMQFLLNPKVVFGNSDVSIGAAGIGTIFSGGGSFGGGLGGFGGGSFGGGGAGGSW